MRSTTRPAVILMVATAAIGLSASDFTRAETHPSVNPKALTDTQREAHCEHWADYAQQVMMVRQKDGDMAAMIREANKDGDSAGSSKGIIVQAFERPQWASVDAKVREVIDFKNKTYMSCLKSLQSAAKN